MRFCLAAIAVLALAAPALAQSLPHLALDSFPEDSRRAIGAAYQDAVAHPNDAAQVGRLAMTLHAWEQFDTAAQAYARARQLERRFDWFYLSGKVESRLAHHETAERLFAEAVRLAPDSLPARLAVADALFEAGDAEGAAREYTRLTTGTTAPHANYGLGRYLEARGEHQQASRTSRPLSGSFRSSAQRGTHSGWRSGISGGSRRRNSRWPRPRSTAHDGRRSTIHSWRGCVLFETTQPRTWIGVWLYSDREM